MKVFGRYEVLDSSNRLITYGHKASFCLEDNTCDRNATKFFQCSNVMDTKGKQGAFSIKILVSNAQILYEIAFKLRH